MLTSSLVGIPLVMRRPPFGGVCSALTQRGHKDCIRFVASTKLAPLPQPGPSRDGVLDSVHRLGCDRDVRRSRRKANDALDGSPRRSPVATRGLAAVRGVSEPPGAATAHVA